MKSFSNCDRMSSQNWLLQNSIINTFLRNFKIPPLGKIFIANGGDNETKKQTLNHYSKHLYRL